VDFKTIPPFFLLLTFATVTSPPPPFWIVAKTFAFQIHQSFSLPSLLLSQASRLSRRNLTMATTGHAVPGGQHYPPSSNGAGGFHANGAPGVAAVPDSYFTESRKGEINELRNLLKGFAAERDQARKRDIIKKVIAYMTLGIDVSRLFTEMMLAIETRYVVA
jgi:hypothetical protein